MHNLRSSINNVLTMVGYSILVSTIIVFPWLIHSLFSSNTILLIGLIVLSLGLTIVLIVFFYKRFIPILGLSVEQQKISTILMLVMTIPLVYILLMSLKIL